MTSGIAGLLLARSLELSCCWQEGVAAVFRLFAVGAAGCVPPAQDCACAIASSSPDAPRAIAARSPGTPADTPRRWHLPPMVLVTASPLAGQIAANGLSRLKPLDG